MLMVLVFCCPLRGQEESYVVEHLSLEDGLPWINIDAVTQDHQGLMWMASFNNGLARYDGSRFRVFDHKPDSKPCLSSNRIKDIITDTEGRIWIAHHEGIDILLPQSLEITHRIPLTHHDGRASGQVNSLYLAPNGDIWATVFEAGVFRFRGGDPNQLSFVSEILGETYINQTSSGQIVCVSYITGMQVFDGDSFRPVFPSYQYQDTAYSLIRPIEDENGIMVGLWLILPDETVEVYRFEGGENLVSGLPDDGITPYVSKQIRDVIRGTQSPKAKNPLLRHPLRIFKDNLGVIWVAPIYGGVFKLKRRELRFTVCPELSGLSLRGMKELADGSMYIATYDGLFRYYQTTNKAFPVGNNKRALFNELLELHGDRLIAISESNGVKEYQLKPPWELVSFEFREESPPVSFVASLPFGDGWVLLGNQKIYRFRPRDLYYETFSTLPTDAKILTYCYEQTRDGRIWVGTTEGVFVLTNKGKVEFSMPRLDYRLGRKSRINDIFEDRKGRIWFATHTYGLLCYDPITQYIQSYDPSSGFLSYETYKIAESHGGDMVWVSTFSGLQCIQTKRQAIHFFNEFDGTAGSEFNTSSFLETRNGRFHFGGTKGLTSFNPYDFRPSVKPLSVPFVAEVLIEDVYSSEITTLNLPPRDTVLRLTHGQNTLEFYFGSNDFFRPKNSTCYVQLEHIDEGWVSLGGLRSVKYYRLPSGYYKMNVKFSNNDDSSKGQVFTLYFEIERIYYKRWWFLALVGLAIIGLGYAGIEFRRQRYRREEKLRRDIADELHNSLGGKISSITNLVHLIKRLNEAGQPFQTELRHLLEQTVKAHSTMSDVIWVLARNKNINSGLVNRLQDYADKWLKTAHIEVDFVSNLADFETNIPLSVKHSLILIFKEILGNILKHTFSEKVFISFLVNQDKSIDFVVRNLFKELKYDAPSGGQGMGIIAQQVALMGGTLRIKAAKDSFEVHIRVDNPTKAWRKK